MPSGRQAATGNPDVARHVSTVSCAETADPAGGLLSRPGPAPRGIRRVIGLFKEEIVFDSRNELAGRLGGDMGPPVLDEILARLVAGGRILVDNDGALVWVYAAGNKKLLECLKKSRPLPPSPGRPSLP